MQVSQPFPQQVNFRYLLYSTALLGLLIACGETKTDPPKQTTSPVAESKTRIIFDTDANNELDDQHALAYLLFNESYFDVAGVTVNATSSGGDIHAHLREAERVMKLCGADGKIPVWKGADSNFARITTNWNPDSYDGQEAVDFMLESTRDTPAVIIAVGKLTHIALALKKDPDFAMRSRIVWLGSNYPEPGEYNQNNDTVAMNYVLNSPIPFEMVTVRYGKPSGTDAVRVTQKTINQKMPGMGPQIKEPIEGRHGGEFRTFGDYSVSLFEHIDYHGDPPSRALFDMVAVALLKNNDWGRRKTIPAPVLIDNEWVDRPSNARKILVWEHFNRQEVLEDFFETIQRAGP